MNKTRHSKELKDKVIADLLSEGAVVAEIARQTGITDNTLYNWRKRALRKGLSPGTNHLLAEKWSSQDKFTAVAETLSMNQIETSEYCRSKGIYPEQLRAWKDACMQANGGVAEDSTRLNEELKKSEKEKKELEKELRRKERALAETAALLVLRKKAAAIWGEEEEE